LEIFLSNHAVYRAQQWNLSYDEVIFVALHGHREYNAGCIFCQLREKDIPQHLPGNHPYRRLAGNVSVLLCSDCHSQVITLYRNKKAFLTDRKKAKHHTQLRSYTCSCCS